jgi:hypothetical protein
MGISGECLLLGGAAGAPVTERQTGPPARGEKRPSRFPECVVFAHRIGTVIGRRGQAIPVISRAQISPSMSIAE